MSARHLLGESSMALRSILARSASSKAVPLRRSLATSSSSLATQNDTVGAYFLLSRLPTVLPTPTAFESAFYAYNAKVQRALFQPFPRDLYFKKGSAAETQFLAEEKEREAQTTETRIAQEAVTSQDVITPYAAGIPVGGLKGQPITSRTTKADETGDTGSLERRLERTLFLVVKDESSGTSWSLPRTEVPKAGAQALHNAAPETVRQLLGKDMDIWMVSNLPVGVIGRDADVKQRGYVMRGHIISGLPSPTRKGIQFAWLTREEMEKRLDSSMWQEVDELLSA